MAVASIGSRQVAGEHSLNQTSDQDGKFSPIGNDKSSSKNFSVPQRAPRATSSSSNVPSVIVPWHGPGPNGGFNSVISNANNNSTFYYCYPQENDYSCAMPNNQTYPCSQNADNQLLGMSFSCPPDAIAPSSAVPGAAEAAVSRASAVAPSSMALGAGMLIYSALQFTPLRKLIPHNL